MDLAVLLEAPAERDLPPGHLEQRRRLLLHALVRSQAAALAPGSVRHRLRRLVGWLGCLLVAVAVTAGASRTDTTGLRLDRGGVAEVAAVVGAGTAICLEAAPATRACVAASAARVRTARTVGALAVR